jgi:putative nucleotidyltransferase with HDIG domain
MSSATTPSRPELPEPLAAALRRKLGGGSIDLPLLPEVAQQVLTATSDENTEVKHLAALVQRDPSMAANLLRIANSSLYAAPVPLVTIPQAVARLGISKIREAALLISCKSRVFRGTSDTVRRLFKHSIAAATFAQELARMRRWNVEEAFLCGLLHDVGKPVLLQTLEDLQRDLGVSLDGESRDFAVQASHAAVGEALVKHWKLPARLGETILYHHDPASAPNCAQTAMMTQLADELAHVALGESARGDAGVRRHPVLEPLNVYPEELDALLARKDQVVEVTQSLT